MEDSRENDRSEFDEKSSILDVLVSAFDFDLDAILLGYPRYAELTERLYRHRWKVMNSSLPAVLLQSCGGFYFTPINHHAL